MWSGSGGEVVLCYAVLSSRVSAVMTCGSGGASPICQELEGTITIIYSVLIKTIVYSEDDV